jgi:hypothetical protein
MSLTQAQKRRLSRPDPSRRHNPYVRLFAFCARSSSIPDAPNVEKCALPKHQAQHRRNKPLMSNRIPYRSLKLLLPL